MEEERKRVIDSDVIEAYRTLIQQEGLKDETVRKYVTDLKKLENYLSGTELTQEKLTAYPEWLMKTQNYKKRSVNAMIASVRKFCHIMGWNELKVKGYALDHAEETNEKKYLSKKEYQKLVTAAIYLRKNWLAMLIQTLGHLDIRYSELSMLTVEAVLKGQLEVTRSQGTVILDIPRDLSESLQEYAAQENIHEGIIFRTASGKLLDRSFVWTKIKELGRAAGLEERRVSLQKIRMPLMTDYYPYYPIPEKTFFEK